MGFDADLIRLFVWYSLTERNEPSPDIILHFSEVDKETLTSALSLPLTPSLSQNWEREGEGVPEGRGWVRAIKLPFLRECGKIESSGLPTKEAK